MAVPPIAAIVRLSPIGQASLWLDARGQLAPNARQALALVCGAADEGLNPADYDCDSIRVLASRTTAGDATSIERSALDRMLTAATLRYLQHLHRGRVDPATVGVRIDVPRDDQEFSARLRDALSTEPIRGLAADVRPRLAQYRQLQTMLRTYRAIALGPPLDPPGPLRRPVRPGDAYQDAGALHRELAVLGDLPSARTPGNPDPAESGRYDGELVDGVRRFQARHGLEPDGVLGLKTIEALRVPIAWRVRQIELALERLRWLSEFETRRLIVLNIPMFRLWAFDTIPPDGLPSFGMDAIVGRALAGQTPVFTAEMNEVVFRPYWNVPVSILRNEVLPAIARNPNYLAAENMEIVAGDGDKVPVVALSAEALDGLRRGRFRVRQLPGPKNALGLVKFVFPNRHDVYMHGTPARALFSRPRRDFSHGCVRVLDPIALAEWVLRDQPEWTRERIVEATTGADTIQVKLAAPVQVILFYTTAAVSPEDGTIRFAEDIYGHDRRLDRALQQAGGGVTRGTRGVP